jgi:non-ribosomal peptide synthetase component F
MSAYCQYSVRCGVSKITARADTAGPAHPLEALVEAPLTPLDFARRTRRLHGSREAVVDGDLRLSYEQFFDRCDRWSSALQGLGVGQGDRVATIAPNTHA